MNSASIILHRVFIVPFYKQLFGILLVIFFALFGIQPDFRTALLINYNILSAITATPVAFMIYTGICVLYLCKCIHFFSTCLRKPAYSFVYELQALPSHARNKQAFVLSLSLLLPIVIYSLLIAIIAIIEKKLNGGILIFCLVLLVILVLSRVINYHIIHPSTNSHRPFLNKFILIPKSMTWFLVTFSMQKQWKILLIIKLISFISLYFFVKNDSEVFEDRVLWLIYLLSLLSHIILIYKNFQFTESDLVFYRTLPLSGLRILLSILFFYTLLFIPEYWALRGLAILQHDAYTYMCMVLGAPAIALLWHCFLYTEDMKLENYITLAAGTALLFFFVSMADHKWLTPVLALAGAFAVFTISFRSFEKKAAIEKPV